MAENVERRQEILCDVAMESWMESQYTTITNVRWAAYKQTLNAEF